MSPRDIAVFAALVLGFAILVTAHVWIVFGLAARHPRWRAPVAFIVAPLAPFWAIREHMTVRGVAWIASAVIYVVARVLGSS